MAKIFTPVKCKGIEGRVIASAWGLHPSFTALAVAIEGGVVQFFQDEGDCLEQRTVRKTFEVTSMAWCPTKPLLAIGWAEGTLSMWSENSSNWQTHDDSDAHAWRSVGVLQWSADGTRLVSGDASGRVVVWKVDPTGRLSTVCTYARTGQITHCAFKPRPRALSAAASIAPSYASVEQPPFFFANDQGSVCIADDMGHCNDAVALGVPLAALLYFQAKERLVVLTKSLVLAQFKMEPGGRMSQVMKAKLSAGRDTGILGCAWLCEGHLATVSMEAMVRVWDLANEDNYVLHVNDEAGVLASSDAAVSLAYHPTKRLLAAGTNSGRVALWALTTPSGADARIDDAAWRMLRPLAVGDTPVRSLAWAPGTNLLVASGDDTVSVCAESTLVRVLQDPWALVQLTAYTFALEDAEKGTQIQLTTPMRTRGADMSGVRVLLWNGTRAEVHEVGPAGDSLEMVSQFHAPSVTLALHKESVYMVTEGRLNVANLKGVVRSTLPFMEAEGAPLLINICHDILSSCTTKGLLKVWDIARNEPRQLAAGRVFDVPGAGPVSSIRANPFGTAVSILTQAAPESAAVAPAGGGAAEAPTPHGRPSRNAASMGPAGGAAVGGAQATGEHAPTLYVYQVESDSFHSYSFASAGAVPVEHAWDATDPKLLGVLTEPSGLGPDGGAIGDVGANGAAGRESNADAGAASGGDATVRSGPGQELTTLFATADYGIKIQDRFYLAKHVESLLGLHCPRIYFACRPLSATADGRDAHVDASDEEGPPADDIPFDRVNGMCRVCTRTMRDFVGNNVERGTPVDPQLREALLAFSFHLANGNMDEAYRAVRTVKSPSVWENMAKMCVKTRRVDVAEVCLGNMGRAHGAAAVRAARAEPEPEARIAMLAIQVGMTDDAARLYRQCGRYDLLNNMLQAQGQWDRALQLAKENDRIHLSTTHYEYARHLEAQGDVEGAIQAFQNAGTHRTEVPRLLFRLGRRAELKEFVDRSSDKELLRWWAKFAESIGDMDGALHYYDMAGDNLARVRVLCFQNRVDDAAELANASNDPAAAFHLARQYEARGMAREAIHFFTRAQRYNQAARLAREHGLSAELQSLSLQAPAQMQEEAASFFEQRGQFDKAVQLYTKAGHMQHAIDLCFRHQLFAQLRDIADSLSEDADPRVLAQCAEFFMDHGQFDKAVHFLVLAGEQSKALDLCVLHNIRITEDVAEKMTSTTKLDDPAAEARRIETLLKVAKCCKRQGSYHLATKKYTQAGDKVKAMKCLLKSGDTEKILFFAGVSRSRDIYILAANYLQNLDWHSDPEVLKKIVDFYKKAKALDQLSAFYEACAGVEVDEYRDYDKALDALREAAKAMEGSRVLAREEKMGTLHARIALVERFVAARRIARSNPQAMIEECNALLSEPGVEAAIRVGDIFALSVEWFASESQYEQAHRMVEQMRARRIALTPYLDQELIDSIYRAVGAEPVVDEPADGAGHADGQVEDEVIDDEVDDD